jgi:hypothetical protein
MDNYTIYCSVLKLIVQLQNNPTICWKDKKQRRIRFKFSDDGRTSIMLVYELLGIDARVIMAITKQGCPVEMGELVLSTLTITKHDAEIDWQKAPEFFQ